ncbi:MAG: prolyl oligopeptidase family serine peptidase [Bacteroidota bacterium]
MLVRFRLFLLALLAFATVPTIAQDADAPDDPFLWLEEVEGDRALSWVGEQNAETVTALEAHPAYDDLYGDILAVLNSDDRIAYPGLRGDFVYNFWTDADNPRGLWRRASVEDYLAGDPTWETLLDIDKLGAEENVNWAYKGSTCLAPDYDRCLIRLSRGGADAAELREFDVPSKTFVDGFYVPEAKSSLAWIDANTLLVSTDWGEGALTDSGYPRIVKRWTRGTPLDDAETVYEGATSDVGVWAASARMGTTSIPVIAHRPSFFEGTTYVLRDGAPVALDLPMDADPSLVDGQLVVYLRSPWTVGETAYPTGALVATDYEAFLAGERAFETVFVPTERQTVQYVASTAHSMIASVLDNVQGQLHRFRFASSSDGQGGAWTSTMIDAPELGSVNVVSTSSEDDRFFFTYSSYLQPTTLYLAGGDDTVAEVTKLPALFDTEGLTVAQHEATSADGTQIPYFIVHREDIALDGTNPTLLYGYGGFEIALTPSYSATAGQAWLERGGVYVVANIRGGGEFGPEWHRAAQKANRQRAYDDFIAVAEDLVARGVTSPDHLGVQGGSNGGLLTGVMVTQRPDLFNAVVIAVPLLDMRRYHTLLAGASWMAEYGDPDNPDEWAYIRQYSPYHNLDADADYPRVLFTTTTRDDRVHPGHARKMAAKMRGLGHEVYYFENTEGGHGAGVTPEQQAQMMAITYAYLLERLR